MNIRWFKQALPEVKDESLPGRLFVLEGPDGSGRTTQINQLVQWLERRGFAVRTCGLGRSVSVLFLPVPDQLRRRDPGAVLRAVFEDLA